MTRRPPPDVPLEGAPLALFSAHGIELEYAIVDAHSLDVRPLSELLLHEAAGEWTSDFEDGEIGWSNELVAHQLEFKTARPAPRLAPMVVPFRESIGRANALLQQWGAQLLPTGMHPWMVPQRETCLWSREGKEIYGAYDRIFDCRRHGWANVQSVHLNLPFAGDTEFARLLAATRVLLPLLPALASSSPIVEGAATGLLDNRLDFYRTNSLRVPMMAGEVIPEPIYAPEPYRRQVLGALARELAPLDPDGVLAGNEWTNARGAIARFDRSAIEVRLIDSQECPRADLALCALVTAVLRDLVQGEQADEPRQAGFPGASLVQLLAATAARGPSAPLEDPTYLALFGLRPGAARSAGELWSLLAERGFEDDEGPLGEAVEVILREGTLAERILSAAHGDLRRERLEEIYRELGTCLAHDRLFRP